MHYSEIRNRDSLRDNERVEFTVEQEKRGPRENILKNGIIPSAWKDLVCEVDSKGKKKTNWIAYELCVFEALREKLRCKKIWVVNSDRYRNPKV